MIVPNSLTMILRHVTVSDIPELCAVLLSWQQLVVNAYHYGSRDFSEFSGLSMIPSLQTAHTQRMQATFIWSLVNLFKQMHLIEDSRGRNSTWQINFKEIRREHVTNKFQWIFEGNNKYMRQRKIRK